MSLPIMQDTNKSFMAMQTTWSAALNPILANPLMDGHILRGVTLRVGDNVINTLLSRKLIGWIVVRQRAASSLFDKQDQNQTPQLTLILNSTAAVTVDILVF